MVLLFDFHCFSSLFACLFVCLFLFVRVCWSLFLFVSLSTRQFCRLGCLSICAFVFCPVCLSVFLAFLKTKKHYANGQYCVSVCTPSNIEDSKNKLTCQKNKKNVKHRQKVLSHTRAKYFTKDVSEIVRFLSFCTFVMCLFDYIISIYVLSLFHYY